MAANELAAHTALQPPVAAAECDQVTKALGSFSPRGGPSAGEQARRTPYGRSLAGPWAPPGV